jgi:hypothetical protein
MPVQRTIVRIERPVAATPLVALIPLAILPAAGLAMLSALPEWKGMWLLAGSIYFGLKWLSFASSSRALDAPVGRALGYLLLWPGMGADAFLDQNAVVERPHFGEWLLAAANLVLGLALLLAVVPRAARENLFAAGWVGMIAFSFLLHFGIAHLLSLGWRLAGVDAQPIMRWPLKASSLTDFWGRRWNMAFRDVAYVHVFRPLVGRIGAAWAAMAVFVVSGLVHDFVISTPVHSGWGRPTLYFLLQGAGVLAERSSAGRRRGLGRGLTGRVFCGVMLVGPIFMLFHEPFVRHAILPTLTAIGVVN